ncbi:MAG: DUF3772 domain-containing protein [Beijerinckiaceae bacterium]|nr:DUF3772 domain-containing protein [Beijerinckiaceae bacterium]
MKRIACLLAFVAVLAAAPFGADLSAKQVRAPRQERVQGSAAAQKPAPSENQKPGDGEQNQAPPQQPLSPPPDNAPIGPALDKLGASLKQIETNLEALHLTDENLQNLRQQIAPVSQAAAELIERLTPRLEGIKARLAQLGPKPSGEGAAESPNVTAERDQQQKFHNETDELLKRARLLTVQAEQTAAHITARRRALFTRSLFARAESIANPAVWAEFWREAPGDITAIRTAFRQWFDGINSQLDGNRRPAFWGAAGLIILLFLPLAWLSRRVLARTPANSNPSRLLKVLGAWWIALVIAVPAAAMAGLIGLLFHYFGLTNARMQPFFWACGEAVIRIAAAAGIARGLFAPTRPNWRLPKLNGNVAEGVVRAAIGLAIVTSATRLFEALNEIVGASLPVAVLMRGLAASAGAIIVGIELWRFGGTVSAEDCLGPEIAKKRDWFDFFRAASWLAVFAIFASVLIGYAAFGSFLADQFFWAGAVVCILFMAAVLAEEAIGASFTPNSRAGQRLIASFGFHRNSLELAGVLLAGLIKVALFILAAALVLAPWGLQSSDVPIDLRAAFFGFKVGDITIAPVSILLAAGIFALAFAAIQAALQWTDAKLLPRTNLDAGLRNSIRTSLGYAGFLTAAILALSYLGLNFEKLAIIAGALSVGIGFGLQSVVNNFVSGLILLWERTVRVGDWIAVGTDQGFVRRINVRATEIETFDRAQVIIPNSSLVAGVVTNLVRNDRTGRIVIPLTVAGTADPDKVREVLVAIAKANPLVLVIPAPQVLFTGMSASALNFELRAYVGDVETMYRAKSDLHFTIFQRFKEEKFFDLPPPAATKIEIAGFEDLGGSLKKQEEAAAPDQPRRGRAGR